MTDPAYIHGAHTLVEHIRHARTGAIVGVLRGVDAWVMLDRLPHLDRLLLVDDWSLRGLPEGFADSAETVRRQAHERLTPYLDRVRWLECPSRWASTWPLPVDFVYLDGDHSRDAVAEDIRNWRSSLVSGGILAGHDYGHPDFPGVKQAVDALLGDEVEVEGTVWLYRVTA